MDFGFSEEQRLIQDSAKKFLVKECPKEKVREIEKSDKGYDRDIWRKMAELGWMGIVFPEEHGGTGGEFMDLVILMEEMGKNILPSPFLSTMVCSLSIMQYGTEEQKKKFLPDIAEGKAIWTPALTEASSSYKASGIETHASAKGDEYVLEGTKVFVPDASVANHMLVVARTGKEAKPEDGITVFIVDAKNPNVEVEVIPTTAHDKPCEIKFDKVKVPKGSILGKANEGWEIVEFMLQRGSVLKSAEVSGASQAALEMTNDYAKKRVQFDRPIGSFQAIQHKLADMLTDIEGLKYLVYDAGWRISAGYPSNLHASIVKVRANEVYERVCIDCVKTHGAMGFTDECDIGLYYRRVKYNQFAFGDSDFHKERIAAELERYSPPKL